MQEERFEVFFQNISGLYRAVQRLRAQFADAAGVSAVHLFWLYLLREYPEGLAASRLAELSNIDRSLVSRQLKPLLERGLVRADGETALRLEAPPDRDRPYARGANCAGSAFYSKPGRARDST